MALSKLTQLMTIKSMINGFNTTDLVQFNEYLLELLPKTTKRIKRKLKRRPTRDLIYEGTVLLAQSLTHDELVELKELMIGITISCPLFDPSDDDYSDRDNDMYNITEDISTGHGDIVHSHYERTCDDQDGNAKIEQDWISLVGSDGIHQIALFLTLRESCMLGCVNIRLFLETRKNGYLLARQDTLMLNTSYTHKFTSMTTAARYPTKLGLRKYVSQEQAKSDLFISLFRRLTHLWCYENQYLPHVPIDKLFSKHLQKQDNMITELLISCQANGYYGKYYGYEQVEKFCTNYNDYFKNQCESNNEIIRSLYVLNVANVTERGKSNSAMLLLCKTLCKNFKKILLNNNCTIRFDTLDELQSVFHDELLEIEFRNNVVLELEEAKLDVAKQELVYLDATAKDETKNKHNTFELCKTLQHLIIDLDFVSNAKLKTLDIFSLRKTITQCTINDTFDAVKNECVYSSLKQTNDRTRHPLDNVFLTDKTPLLNQIHIKIYNDFKLWKTLWYFEYLFKKRRMIRSLKHWQSLSIEWIMSNKCSFEVFQSLKVKSKETFGIPKPKSRSAAGFKINKRKMEIVDCDLDRKTMHRLFWNIQDWLQRVSKHGQYTSRVCVIVPAAC